MDTERNLCIVKNIVSLAYALLQ